MRKWVELFDEPWPSLMNQSFTFWLFLSYLWLFVGVSSCWPCSSMKKLCTLWSRGACCVPEVKSWQRPTLHTTHSCLFYKLIPGYKLEPFWVKAEFIQSTVWYIWKHTPASRYIVAFQQHRPTVHHILKIQSLCTIVQDHSPCTTHFTEFYDLSHNKHKA